MLAEIAPPLKLIVLGGERAAFSSRNGAGVM
jgi:hypothetical protein